MRSLVVGELTSARREITGKVLGARPAMAKSGAAAVLGAMNAVTSAATLVRALNRGLPGTVVALAATALLGGAAAALAAAAREERRGIGSPVPEQTMQSVRASGGRRRGHRRRRHQLRRQVASLASIGSAADLVHSPSRGRRRGG